MNIVRGACRQDATSIARLLAVRDGVRRALRDVALCTALALISAVPVSCSSGNTIKCHADGDRTEDVGTSRAQDLVVLLDISDNSAAAARKIANQVVPVIGEVLEAHPKVVISGATTGGDPKKSTIISCMDGERYEVSGSSKKADERRALIEKALTEAIERAVAETRVVRQADVRTTLSLLPELVGDLPGDHGGAPNNNLTPKVILWSTFLSQGTDCLEFNSGDQPSYQLAAKAVADCQDLGLLQQRVEADMIVVGAGSNVTDRALADFATTIGSEICGRVAASCDTRQTEVETD